MSTFIRIIAMMVLFCPLSSFAQDAAMTSIRKIVAERYPGFEIDETESESWCNGEKLIEVEIEKGGDADEEEMTLLFSAKGQLLYQESSINPAGLPSAVKDAFRKACPDCKEPKEADVLTALDGSPDVFELEVRKGLRERTFLIDIHGNLLCRL